MEERVSPICTTYFFVVTIFKIMLSLKGRLLVTLGRISKKQVHGEMTERVQNCEGFHIFQ